MRTETMDAAYLTIGAMFFAGTFILVRAISHLQAGGEKP
jgi:hypothetical protein